MSAVGYTERPCRTMNVYASYRNELGKTMKEIQTGSQNSQFGKHWFTNRNTGECKTFYKCPDETWIEGRFLFRGESCKIHFTGKLNFEEKIKIRKLWDLFHNGNYTSLNEFSKTVGYTQPNLTSKFKKYIPLYNKISKQRFSFNPNKNFIGIYK